MSGSKLSADTLKYIDMFIKKLSTPLDFSPQEKTDFAEELKSNLISSIEELIKQGNTEKEALQIALVRFGDKYSIDEELGNSEARNKTTPNADEKLLRTEQKLKREDEKHRFVKRILGVTFGFVFAMLSVLNSMRAPDVIIPALGVLVGYIYAILAIVHKYKKANMDYE